MDGDELREAFGNQDYSPAARRAHNLTVARLAKTFSKQWPVIVSVIAPQRSVRAEITKICDPIWIWIKRESLPARAGHFYEEPDNYWTVDPDFQSYAECVDEILSVYRTVK